MQHMDKRFWTVVAVIFLVFGALFLSQQKQRDAAPVTGATNHVVGNTNSKVTLVEYGDYQCSACQSFAPTSDTIRKTYADRVKFQFRNLPLTQIHPNAFAAARAAEAAGLQGKFWEMHDALYESTKWAQWTNAKDPLPLFEQYARELSLDTSRFTSDLKSTKVNDMINADVDAFNATKTETATPAFFLNGTRLSNNDFLDEKGAPSIEKFSAKLDEALKNSQK